MLRTPMRFSILPLLLLCAAAPCPEIFASGAAPTGGSGPILCNATYAAQEMPSAREPLWSAEHLTEESLEQAEALHGRGQFHEDLRVPVGERATLEDYKHSGWTRGHLSPSGDAPTRESRGETFALSNIVAQAERLNSGRLSRIEKNVRRLTEREGETYVVTGPAFRAALGTIGPDHVRIPSSVWKEVYVPSLNAVSVVACKNTVPYSCNAVAPSSLVRSTGVNPFPGIADQDRMRSAVLDRQLLR